MFDVSKAIDQLLSGVVPERTDELKTAWGQEGDRVRLQDCAGFLMQQVYGTVQVNELALKQIWFIGYAAWKAVDAYTGAIRILQMTNMPFDIALLRQIDGQGAADDAFDRALHQARDLSSAHTIDDFDWPKDIPFPIEGNKLTDQREKAVFDLICMAGGYIFLHEIRHAQLWRDNLNPTEAIDEEVECDTYALKMMLDGVPIYAVQHGYSEELVRAKRAIGILLAKLVILHVTPKELWIGSADHPAVKDRIRFALRGIGDPVPGWFWDACAAMLAAFARHYDLITSPIKFASTKELAMILCEKFGA